MKKIFILCLAPILLSSCQINNETKATNNENASISFGSFTQDDYLMAKGNDIINKKDEVVHLRGTNMGGYSIVETWMSYLRINNTHMDHVNMNKVLIDRFGEDGCLRFWEEYRDNYFTENDFINCKNMNMNCLRFPFSYMSVDPDYYNIERIEGEKYNFRILDNFISLASKYGMYTILDLHGTYGSQNGQNHSGQIFDTKAEVDFYSNIENQNKTIDLWKAITLRYKDNPSIAGFDLLNEPGEKAGATNKIHWDVLDKIYQGIREIDKDRLIIMESCWGADNLPTPSTYGWENIMYSFHEYTSQYSNSTKHMTSVQNKINAIKKKDFNVPIQVGEFVGYALETSWRRMLQFYNDNNIHWNTWTYKIHRVATITNSVLGFGIFVKKEDNAIYLDDKNETLDTLIQKLSLFRTDRNFAVSFHSGVTLERLLREYCL